MKNKLSKLLDVKNVPYLICSFLFLGLLSIMALVCFDNDDYFLIATGRYIVEHGIPKYNPFTMVDGLEIVIQQVPWAILMYLLYNYFGKIGIFVFIGLCAALIAYLITLIGKEVNHGSHLNKYIALCTCIILSPFMTGRPTVVTIILILLQILVTEKYRNGKIGKSIIFYLTIISLLEINFHAAAWIVHFVLLLPYIVPPIINPVIRFSKQNFKLVKHLVISIFPMTGALFLNPYGCKNILYLIYSYGDQLKECNIMELQVPEVTDFKIVVLLAIICTITYLISKHRKKQFSAPLFYLCCGFLIMSFMHIRNVWYGFIGILPLLFELIKFEDIKERKSKANKISIASLCLGLIVCVFLIFSRGTANLSAKTEDDIHTPVKAIEYLKKNNVDKNTKIYTEFNNGAYFEFLGYKCFIDPRPELYFKKLNKKVDLMDECNKVTSFYVSFDEIKEFLEKYNFEYLVVTDCNSNLYTYLTEVEETGYTVAVEGENYTFFKKGKFKC